MQAARTNQTPAPVLIRGVVVLNGRTIVIEDRTSATEIRPLHDLAVALGDEVEVSGRMTLAPHPLVQEAQVHRLWGGSTPPPLSLTPDEAATGENECSLIETAAKLVSVDPAGLTGVRLNLQGGDQSFSAVLPREVNPTLSAAIRPGATLQLTGILMVARSPESDPNDAFQLVLRSGEDVQVVLPPSWWTMPHLSFLGGVAAILLLLAINGYNRVKHARFRAVAEERANIARDIHDTLAQSYAGIALQLEAAEQLIGSNPAQARGLLSQALQMVRHSRNESHLAIDVLRSMTRNDQLEVLVAHSMRQLQQACPAQLKLEISGHAPQLSFRRVNNLFRITQQAMANAAQHAAATRIVTRIGYTRDAVLLEVEDDGKGFDTVHPPGLDEGHYGLTGMQERAASIGAAFSIQSSPAGTLVRVKVNP